MNNTIDSQNLEIRFGGDLHEIDADIFIESLVSYSTVVGEIIGHIAPKSKIQIKIQAPKEGSFIIVLNLVTDVVQNLFTKENISVAAEVMTIIGGLYGLKKWMSKNGKPVKVEYLEEDKIEVSNNKGSTIIVEKNVYNIYQGSPRVRENLRKTFIRLKENDEILDFSMRDNEGNELFKIYKEDFEAMSSDSDEIPKRKQVEIKQNQELSIFKIVFDENYKWEFYYQGNKIYVAIQDHDFFEQIQKGEIAFKSGDTMIVNMEIGQVFNEVANTFTNESYSIVKVIEHVPRAPDPFQSFIEL